VTWINCCTTHHASTCQISRFHLIPCPNTPTYLALYKVSRATLAANLTAIRAGVAALMDEITPLIDATEAA